MQLWPWRHVVHSRTGFNLWSVCDNLVHCEKVPHSVTVSHVSVLTCSFVFRSKIDAVPSSFFSFLSRFCSVKRDKLINQLHEWRDNWRWRWWRQRFLLYLYTLPITVLIWFIIILSSRIATAPQWGEFDPSKVLSIQPRRSEWTLMLLPSVVTAIHWTASQKLNETCINWLTRTLIISFGWHPYLVHILNI
jgi:hypothetical protein